MTPDKVAALRAALPTMSQAEKLHVLGLLEEWEKRQGAQKARNSLLAFVKRINTNYKVGPHHKILAQKLEAAARGHIDRLATAIAPRFGKSLLLSLYFPAWFIGNFPDQKLIISSHTADLAVDFGRKVRNLIDSPAYKEIFPGLTLSADSKSAGRWTTGEGAEFFAVGVGGAVAGRGADLLIIDDPFSEQDVLNGNYEVFDKVYEWYAYGARTRLMPGGRVVVLHTRWAKNDLIGRLIEEAAKNEESDQWEYIEFPAIINEGTDNEKSLWPEQWTLESLKRTRASMPTFQWQAQYQQAPTSQSGALIKKEWWRIWKGVDPPECDYIIMALDAAQEATKRSDFTALTTWGVFYRDDEATGEKTAAIILLNAINKRMEFPELKDLALREYRSWEPDCFIIEKKSNGAALAQELRRMGIPLQDFTPSRGAPGNANTKYARVNAVADIVRSGLVWVPEYKWADEVVDQCNDFPAGKNDDLVDTVVMALMRFRSGGFITLPTDDEIDTPRFAPKRRAYYRVSA
jgi:predicted phage terminase large subunit-like protein